MVVDVGRAEGEERRAAAAEEQLRDHEDEDGHGRGLVGLLDAVVLAADEVAVRAQRGRVQAWKREERQQRG